MREIIFENLDTEDIVYLVGKGRKVKEFYGAFDYKPKDKDVVPAELPYSSKIVDGKEVPMSVLEYFNTVAGDYVYAQVRTAPVVDGKDPNTFTYPSDEQLKVLVNYFGLNKIKDEKTFIDKQKELMDKQKELEVIDR